jgi:choline dehydrogenase
LDTFDYVIVGGGSAGALLAARLSESPGVTICLIEAGPRDTNPLIHIPAGFIKVIFDPKLTWSFETEPGPAIKNRKIPALQGRVLGGSGSINGMVYTRGQAADFDTWAQLGNEGWSYSDILPYFKRSEDKMGPGDEAYRGRNGALPVVDLRWRNEITEAFIASAQALGYPYNPDYNGATQEGVGRYQYTIRNGRRVSAARAFLLPAMGSKGGIDLRTDTLATSILFAGRKAVGVRTMPTQGGATQEIHAKREVILSAGALNTPKLMQLSGLGPGALLQSLGIPVLRDMAGVGANLHDHYTPRFVLKAKGATTINDVAHGFRLAGQFANWVLRRPSILGIGVVLGELYCKSKPGLEHPDILVTFTPGSFKAGFLGVLDDVPGMTCGVWQLRPESRGFVHARSADPLAKPLIQPNFLASPADQETVVTAMKLARKILAQPQLAQYIDEEMIPGPGMQTDAQMLDYAQSQGLCGYHYCGTARMGSEGDKNAVVDAQLRVHGFENLRVVDASVMPQITSGNTNAPTMMIAEKAADMILGRTPEWLVQES